MYRDRRTEMGSYIEFELTESHLRLLQRFNVDYDDRMEYGAPMIDPKRPYGDSDVAESIAEILGWESMETDDGPAWPKGTADRAREIHETTAMALQIVLRMQAFEPGFYVSEDYGYTWRKRGSADVLA